MIINDIPINIGNDNKNEYYYSKIKYWPQTIQVTSALINYNFVYF